MYVHWYKYFVKLSGLWIMNWSFDWIHFEEIVSKYFIDTDSIAIVHCNTNEKTNVEVKKLSFLPSSPSKLTNNKTSKYQITKAIIHSHHTFFYLVLVWYNKLGQKISAKKVLTEFVKELWNHDNYLYQENNS